MNKKIYFLVFIPIFLILLINANTQLGGGGGQGGMSSPMSGCWNLNTEPTCANMSDSFNCRWNFMTGGGGGLMGWCEEKGCNSYWNEPECTSANCTWSNPGGVGYCYKKGCWDNSNLTTCELANCRWDSYGYCYEVGCWDFNKKSTCEQANVTNNLNCRWQDMGTVDTSDDYCYEVGCWDYSTNATCSVHSASDCVWGSQGGWCSDIGCWDFNNKNTCNAAEGCSWNGWDQCRNRGCRDLTSSILCEDGTDNFNCVWDDTYNYCKDIGCWYYELSTNESACVNNAYNITCVWNSNSNYCYEPYCNDYTTESICNAQSSSNCYWDSQWSQCHERGCWDFGQNQTSCEILTNPFSLECAWKIGGYCNQPSCWNYNTSVLCNIHSDKCTWDATYSQCYEKGCWNYNNQTSCLDESDTFHIIFDCRWNWHNESDHDQGGWCYKPECWNYIDEINCTNTTDEITCKWDANSNYCYKQGCWDYNETVCENTMLHPDMLNCAWDTNSNYCYEQGCWNYGQNSTYCEANECLWQSGTGWCERNQTQVANCWEIKDNTTCSAVVDNACVWESFGSCNKEGCWNYGNEVDCNIHAAERCIWDTSYSNCYQKGCWEYTNQTSCTAASCKWDANSNYCYEEGCWKYSINETCSDTTDTLTCKWEAHEYCYKQGCWDYTNNATCVDNDCKWQESGRCEGQNNCWNYYDNTTCAQQGCNWITSGWCDRIGPWQYNNNQTCAAAGFLWKLEGGWCNEQSQVECWNWDYNSSGCSNNEACRWEDPRCVKKGCWELMSEPSCGSAPDVLKCQWKNETMTSNGWCEELGCWGFGETDCLNATAKYGMTCAYQTFGFCEMKDCWMHENQSTCNDVTDNLDCEWSGQQQGECKDPCQNYYMNETCSNAGCEWAPGQYCHSLVNCWGYSNNDTACLENSCSWREPGWCEGKSGPGDCYQYMNSSVCVADNECKWKTGWCNKKGCWNYWDSTNCTNITLHPTVNCSWTQDQYAPGGGRCEELGCWNFWQNESACENNVADITCNWRTESWNQNGGFCEKEGCWNYYDNITCSAHSAQCQWHQDPSGFGGWCNEKGCWSKETQAQCINDNTCSWRTNSKCELAKCWMFDNKSLQGAATEAGCVNNSYGLNCTWDTNGGWCNEYNAGCAAYNNDREGCKWTGFCMWNEANQTCDNPGTVWLNDMASEKKNPGCWMFDYEQTYCNSTYVDICTWSNSTDVCTATKDTGDLGIQCLNIQDSTLCEGISVLSTCCVWKNNKCQADTSATKCWTNFRQPPEGASFCNDYNSFKDQSLCEQIAGDPWYMPCKWDTKDTADTSDDRCVFRKDVKFSGEDKGCEGITSKKDCEFAGCSWKQEYYCEEGKAVPSGWCEEKTGAGSTSCDEDCWSCEFYDSSGNAVNSTNAQTACENSDLGYCQFTPDTKAPNGIGFCDERNEIKFGSGDCSVDCMACEFKSSPESACEQSSANCKWVSDTTGTVAAGGKCYPKTEKTCTEDCFRCYTETECVNYGGGTKGTCTWDSGIKICKPKNFNKEICFDGDDNDGDGNFDCEDSDCLSDPFCGAGSTSNCWMYSESECKNFTIVGAEECIWIVDSYEGKSWCGVKGENCFLWDGDQTGCGQQQGICQWFPYDNSNQEFGGFCDMNKTKMQICFKITTQSGCIKNLDCTWTPDSKSSNGGRCEPRISKCELKNQIECEAGEWSSRCKWVTEEGIGKCKPACITNQLSKNSTCKSNPNCQWVTGWCDPSESLGMKGEDCWKYDNNETACVIAKACDWMGGGGKCDINGTKNWECQNMRSQESCNGVSHCKWNGDQLTGWCDAKIFACGWYQNSTECIQDSNNYGCVWKSPCECMWNPGPEHPNGCEVLCRNSVIEGTCNVTAGCQWTNRPAHCEPQCFDMDNSQCNNFTATQGFCELVQGACEPKFAKEMFGGMDIKPVDLGFDSNGCGAQSPDSILPDELDICGFGLVEEPDKFNIGIGVDSLNDAAMCNGQKIVKSSDPGMPSLTISESGEGTNTTKLYWYLDTDGSESDGCSLHNDLSQAGYEFFLKYIAKWENGGVKELKTAYRCENGQWIMIPGDLKISTWQTMSCSEAGSVIIIIDKNDLKKFENVYKPWEKLRIYIASAGANNNASNPTDTTGPGVYTPGSIGAKTTFDMKGFKQQGFFTGEDCFNGIDDNYNDMIDCNDPDCRSSPKCTGVGVNAGNYTDTTSPMLVNSKVEKFPDSAFIKYDTDEPANGTVQFYYNDSECSGSNSTGYDRYVYDMGIINSYMEDYKNWHDAPLDNMQFNQRKLGYSLINGTTYYYKIKYCDPSGNCGITACLNFTTPTSTKKSDCPMCSATVKIPQNMKIDFGDGYVSYDDVSGCGGTGVQANNTQLMSADISINGSGGTGSVLFENTTILNPDLGSPEVIDNTTTVDGYEVGYVGMESEEWNNLSSKMSPEACIVPVPKGSGGDCDQLWQCDTPVNGSFDESTCHVVDAILMEETDTQCQWKLKDCKFSVYRADTGGATTTTIGGNPPLGGGGGGGGGAATTIRVTTTTVVVQTTTSLSTTVPLSKEEIVPEKRKISLPTEISGIPTWIIGIIIGTFVVVGLFIFVFMNKRRKPKFPEKDIKEKFTLPDFDQ